VKHSFVALALVLLISSLSTAQQPATDILFLKNGSIIRGQILEFNAGTNVKIKTADGSIFVYPASDVEKIVKEESATKSTVAPPEQIPEAQAPTQDEGIQFAVGGQLFVSPQIWNNLETDKSKLGFGLAGTLVAGIQIDDAIFGVGPHLGYSFWSNSETIAGRTATSTTNVGDYGINIVSVWDDLYILIGLGGAEVSVTATVGGDSETVRLPEDASYQRVGFGWVDTFAFGLSYVSYRNWARNLSRFEINLGVGF